MAKSGAKFPTAIDKRGPIVIKNPQAPLPFLYAATRLPGATFAQYRAERAPAIFLIDREGKIRYQNPAITALDQALAELTAE